MDYIKQQYKKSFLFFKENLMKLTFAVSAIFILVIIVSAIYLKDHPDQVLSMMNDFMKMVDASGIISENGSVSSIALMFNNIRACLLSIVIGFLPFLFLPLITLITNAALMGAMFGLYSIMDISYTSLFAGLVPHGIFEIPALVISMTLGIYLCKEMTMKVLGKRKETKITDTFGSIFNYFVCILVPLLIIAGIIEAYITPSIMEMFM